MIGGLPSATALIVACARGIDGEPDALAHCLVPRAIAAPLLGALRRVSFGLVAHIRARTSAIDAVVRELAPKQLVVLGAGLDTRAHRLAELRDATVFEVDHPSMHGYKRPRAAALPRLARAIEYVSVDFERDDLAARLAEAGHDPSAPTTWIWEGVTMYLTADAVTATLATIAARSAAASSLVLSYAVPGIARWAKPGFALLGERLRFLTTPDEMAALLGRHGFEVVDDTPPTTWITERLVVARRPSLSRAVPS